MESFSEPCVQHPVKYQARDITHRVMSRGVPDHEEDSSRTWHRGTLPPTVGGANPGYGERSVYRERVLIFSLANYGWSVRGVTQ